MRRSTALAPLLLCLPVGAPLAAQQAAQVEPEEEAPSGSGEDILDLARRIDLRVELSEDDGENQWVTTLRHDHRLKLGDGWQANLRIDLPFIADLDEVKGPNFVSGDVLLNAGFTRRLPNREGFGVGTQLIIPTAEDGRGQWRLRPSVGYRWPATAISPDSFFQLQVRYDLSFAGESTAPDTRQLQVAPTLEIGLPDRFYLSFFPSTDLRYDFERDELFIPFDVEVGKEWDRWVASLEGSVGVITEQNAPYDWKIEARIGRNF